MAGRAVRAGHDGGASPVRACPPSPSPPGRSGPAVGLPCPPTLTDHSPHLRGYFLFSPTDSPMMRATIPSKSTTTTAKISIFWRGREGRRGWLHLPCVGGGCWRAEVGTEEPRRAKDAADPAIGQEGLRPHQLITPEGRRGFRAGSGGGTERDSAANPMEVTRGEEGWLRVTGGRREPLGSSGGPLGVTGGH